MKNVPLLLLPLLLPLACGSAASVGAADQLAGPLVRTGASLDGEWQIIVDPYETGSLDYLSKPRAAGFWSSAGPSSPADLEEWSFTDSDVLRVPGDWNTQREALFFYEGTVWYRRTFEAAPTPGRRAFLAFGGANKRATVWVNGARVGEHAVGFTPFHLEVTSALRAGVNDVTVRVNNHRRPEGVPALNTDWWNYGGLTREVRLVETAATFVRDLEVGFDGERIVATVRLDGVGAAGAEVEIAIDELGLIERARADGQGRCEVSFETPSALQRWSPEAPRLYDVRAAIAGAALTERIGFRTVSTRGHEILLNEEPVFLRGVSIHEEALSRRGRAATEADARELLGLAKALGCNYVRLAHYPHNAHMLRVADELGLLVWAEIPVYWTLEYDNPETLAEAKRHLSEMIERDRNRASVIIWSVGNETGDDPVRTAFRLALGEHVKALDPTRLLSAAMFARAMVEDGAPVRLIVEDPFGELADVLAINSYIGWYWGSAEHLQACAVERAWDKPLLVSEFGAGVKRGLRGGQADRWTEEHGLRIYRETLAWLAGIDGLAGLSPWVLKDFLSPRRQLTGVQDWYNRKGLVDEVGAPKDVFALLRGFYARLAATPGAAPGELRSR